MHIEVTDGTQNRAILMPGRHSPPPAGTPPAPETLQRPKRKTAKQKKEALQYLPEVGHGSRTPSTAPPEPTLPPPASPAETPNDNPSQPPDLAPSDAVPTVAAGPNTPSRGGLISVGGVQFHH